MGPEDTGRLGYDRATRYQVCTVFFNRVIKGRTKAISCFVCGAGGCSKLGVLRAANANSARVGCCPTLTSALRRRGQLCRARLRGVGLRQFRRGGRLMGGHQRRLSRVQRKVCTMQCCFCLAMCAGRHNAVGKVRLCGKGFFTGDNCSTCRGVIRCLAGGCGCGPHMTRLQLPHTRYNSFRFRCVGCRLSCTL